MASSREQSEFSYAPPGLVLSIHSFLFSPFFMSLLSSVSLPIPGGRTDVPGPYPTSRRLFCGILGLDLWAELGALIDMVPGFSLAFNGMKGFRAARGERGA